MYSGDIVPSRFTYGNNTGTVDMYLKLELIWFQHVPLKFKKAPILFSRTAIFLQYVA